MAEYADLWAAIPPWDQGIYAQMPTSTSYGAISTSEPTLIAPPDPMRIFLAFVRDGQSPLSLISTDPTFGGGATKMGFILNTTTLSIVFTSVLHGPIVQAAWYALAGQLGANVCVITQSVISWPKQGELPGGPILGTVDVGPKRPAQQIETAPGVNGKRGILDYWHQLVRRFGVGK